MIVIECCIAFGGMIFLWEWAWVKLRGKREVSSQILRRGWTDWKVVKRYMPKAAMKF